MKRLKWLILFGTLALVGAAVLAVMPRGRTNSLLTRATRVCPANAWGMHYFWLDDRRILTFRSGRQSGARAFEIDTFTGQEKVLAGLTNTFRDFEPTGERDVSPDGKWLLWTAKRAGAFPPNVIASRLDGSERLIWHSGQNLAWLPDSSGYVKYLTRNRQATLRIQPLGSTDRETIAIRPIQNQPQSVGGMSVLSGELLGPLPNGNYFLANLHAWWNPGRVIYLYELDYRPSGRSICRTIKLPVIGMPVSATLSPDGRRLAWVIHTFAPQSGVMRFLAQIIPQLWKRPTFVLALWTSDTNGADFRFLGQDAHPDGRVNPMGLFDRVQWTPDSRRISFISRDNLYTIPADSR